MHEEKGPPTCRFCGARMSVRQMVTGQIVGTCTNEDCWAIVTFVKRINYAVRGDVRDIEEYMRRFRRRPDDEEHMEGE